MKRALFFMLFVMFINTFCFLTHRASAQEDIFRITVIDVGKGDCILVQTGNAADPVNVMIDTGYDNTADAVIAYLNENGIEKIHALIISHFHKDHVGGAAAILERVPVDKVYMPDYEGTRKVYEAMMNVLNDPKCTVPFDRLSGGIEFHLSGASYHLYPSVIRFDGDNDNDVSMAAAIEYEGHKALFAGDLEDEGIRQFLEKNTIPEKYYDILKLPHHGAEEARTPDLLKLLKEGGTAVITDGKNQRAYGTLIDKLETDGFPYTCSAADGTVIIEASDSGYNIRKEKNPEYSEEGDWKYILLDNNTAAVTGYSGNAAVVTIPSSLGGHTVTAIEDFAFYNNKTVTAVTVPDTVASIGDSVFSWCRELKEVSLPENLQTIGEAAFSHITGMEEITIPGSVKSIGESGFESCTGLKSITLPPGLTAIAPSLFERCENLESIAIPEGVKSIGKEAFKRCEKLTAISIPSSVTLIDEEAFKRCTSLKSLDLPESIRKIEESAFENCTALKDFAIPSGVTSIGKSAFRNCQSLEAVVIPAGIDSIKKSAFSGCSTLKSVSIPVSVTSFKAEVFMDCRNLYDIRYAGTMAEWDALDKGKNWNKNCPQDQKIHCSDSPEPEPEPEPDPQPDDPGRRSDIRFFNLPEMPKTGFSAIHPETPAARPKDLYYEPTGLTLQIPSLDLSKAIVRLPFRDGEYAVEWLDDSIGLPEDLPLPGTGLSILTGHNHLDAVNAGPFALLRDLPLNARLYITDSSSDLMAFSVFANEKIPADDPSALPDLSGRWKNTLFLITCEDEQPDGSYAFRRVIAAGQL